MQKGAYLEHIPLYLADFNIQLGRTCSKVKNPRKYEGFSTVELRRGRDSNPRRGYKPLTHLAGELSSIMPSAGSKYVDTIVMKRKLSWHHYTKTKIRYISICHNGKRITKSLRTKDYSTAKRLKSFTETSLLQQVNGFIESNAELPFPKLVDRFLKASHPWFKSTYDLNKYILISYLQGKKLPANPSSRATHIRHINQCWKWGYKNNLVSKMNLIPGDTKGESRVRTYTQCELNQIFTGVKDPSFNSFIRFAYYTGARSGEIRSISRDNVLEDSLVVRGKTGRRMVKLNTQAKDIIHNQDTLWNYTKDYVSHKFKKEVRRLELVMLAFMIYEEPLV